MKSPTSMGNNLSECCLGMEWAWKNAAQGHDSCDGRQFQWGGP